MRDSDPRHRTSWATFILILLTLAATGAGALIMGYQAHQRSEQEKTRLIREAVEEQMRREMQMIFIQRDKTKATRATEAGLHMLAFGEWLLKERNRADACGQFLKADSKDPNVALTPEWRSFAQEFVKRGDANLGWMMIDRSVRRDPANQEFKNLWRELLASVYIESGNYEESISLLESLPASPQRDALLDGAREK